MEWGPSGPGLSLGLSSPEKPAPQVFTPLGLLGCQVSSGCPHACASEALAVQGGAGAERGAGAPRVRPRSLLHHPPSKLAVLKGGAL